jgi:cytochrome c-type biogenesis protein CcmH
VFPALLLSLALSQGYAPTREGTTPLDQTREMRVQRVGKQIRCAVCQGVSIADSPASMARAQLDKVRELVVEGKTDDEIYDYFVERYGEWSLMEPKKSGVTLGLWVLPVLLLVGGLVYILASARGKQPPAPPAGGAPAESPGAAEDPFMAQVRADLEKDR